MNIPDSMPVLSRGNHFNPASGACVMEMVSVLAGEEFSDNPQCVDSYLRNSAINVNDFVSDDNRAKIALMVPRFIGTRKGNPSIDPFDYDEELVQAVSERLKSEPKLDFLYENKNDYSREGTKTVSDIVKELGAHFRMIQDESKRKTNEEYDDLAIMVLEIALDEYDKMNGRGEYAMTLEEAFEQFSTHVSQKANA